MNGIIRTARWSVTIPRLGFVSPVLTCWPHMQALKQAAPWTKALFLTDTFTEPKSCDLCAFELRKAAA